MKTAVRAILALAAVALVPAALPGGESSLVDALRADRGTSGVVISGKVAEVPTGTRVDLELNQRDGKSLKTPPSASVRLRDDGTFSTEPFTSLPAGRYAVTMTSMFTSIWQTPEVLRAVGVDVDAQGRSQPYTDPRKLPRTADFKPFDREFPEASRYLEVVRQVVVPPAPAGDAAIETVKAAHLTLPDQGRSELNIEQVTRLFSLMPGFKPLSWSSTAGEAGRWIVVLQCLDGGAQKEAKWEYDPKTKRVRYLDPLAKSLSWGQRQYGAPGDLGYPDR